MKPFYRTILVTLRPIDSQIIVECKMGNLLDYAESCIIVDKSSYQIKDAIVKTISNDLTKRHQSKSLNLKELVGCYAIPSNVSIIKQRVFAATQAMQNNILDILSESIKVLLQAEILLWKEKGCSSIIDYQKNFEKEHSGICVYFNGSKKNRKYYEEHFLELQKKNIWFYRNKFCSMVADKNGFWITSSLNDNFQELSIVIKVNANDIISYAHGDMAKVPRPICREAINSIPKLHGKSISLFKELVKQYQGIEGCVHFADLIRDCGLIFEYYKKHKRLEENDCQRFV